jgi:hypothetical protein
VLEAPGVVEIKYRERELQQLLSKCDPRLNAIETVLARQAKEGKHPSEELQKEAQTRREK